MQCSSVLIVEDEETIRDTLRLSLELEGYEVRTACNGKEALEVLPRMRRPCLILLDLMMPVMDGWGFVDAVDKDVTLATIPIVVVTAFSGSEKSIHAKQIVKKPFDLNELLHIVGQYCA